MLRVTAERRAILLLASVLLALALPAVIDPGAVARAAALIPAEGAAAYWVPQHAVLLYGWTPIVVLSAFILVLGPGLVLVYAASSVRSAAAWMLLGLASSSVLLSVVVEVTEAITGGALQGRGFSTLACALTLACTVVGVVIATPSRRMVIERRERQVIASAVIASALLLVLLLPKFLWEAFNGDGAHAFEATRLLLRSPVPFFGSDAGPVSSYPGITSSLSHYPVSWFLRLFGSIEASVRLPYLLFLSAGLYAGLMALIQSGRRSDDVVHGAWLSWLGLGVFTVVMTFSASYDAYHADIALPATREVLVVAWFLGFLWSFAEQRRAWLPVLAALCYLTSPMGMVLIGLWIALTPLIWRPVPWNSVFVTGGLLVVFVAFGRLAPSLFDVLALRPPGEEHALGGLVARVLNVQLTDWRRILFLLIPAGILPALCLFAWKWQDQVGRLVGAIALAEFGFFYVQRRVGLHYFAPAMVLPLAVFWRMVPALPGSRYLRAGVVVAAVAALAVSLPAETAPHAASRTVGLRIEDRLDGYDASLPSAFRRSTLLASLFPGVSHPSVPRDAYGGSPLAWFYYAHRSDMSGKATYWLQRAGDPPPPGARLLSEKNGAALYVGSDSALSLHRIFRPPTTIAPIFRLRKRTLFTG
jgi:hypothetical protein